MSASYDFVRVFQWKHDPEQLESNLTTFAIEEKAPTPPALCHISLKIPSHFHIWDTPRYSKSHEKVRFEAYFQIVEVYIGPVLFSP